MTLVSESIFGPGYGYERRGIENPAEPLEPDWGDPPADGRVVVTEDNAVTLAAVWQAVNVLSGDVAQLPIKVYQRLDGTGKDTDRAHPTWRLLHRRPSRDFGPFQFKQWMMYHALLRGNAYARIRRAGDAAIELLPLEPNTVTPELREGQLIYDYRPEKGPQATLSADEVFHLRGPGGDTIQGQSIIGIARDSMGVGMSAQRYGERFFANNATPRVALEVGEKMNAEAAKNLLRHWKRQHSGPANAGNPALLDGGTKLHTFQMSNEDAQFLATREFSRSEVASWFNLPPHKVGDLTRATFSNIEQQSIDYVVYSLMPWLVRWQDECNAKLFTEAEIAADSHFCEFEVAALLRGDFKGRTEGYAAAIQSGWMVRNEVRERENLNPIDGLDSPLQPMNMDAVGDSSEPEESGEGVRSLYQDFLSMAASRAWQRLLTHAAKSAKSPGDLQAWWAGNRQREAELAAGTLEPVVASGRRCAAGDHAAAAIAEQVISAADRAINEELDGPAGGLRQRLNKRAGECNLPLADLIGG